jgi:REP element-mobilizing transposase RayT
MPRCARQLVTGETYHLTSRGTDRRDVFLDDDDRQRFVLRLGAACTKRVVSCLGYCLMGNHVHLVVRGEAQSVSACMRDVLGGHAQFFNRRHARTGHLFGGRFHDVHVATDRQLSAVLRYVALNPVRAGLVTVPEAWPWSSYAALLAGVVHPGTCDVAALADSVLPADVPRVTLVRYLKTLVETGLADARLEARMRE